MSDKEKSKCAICGHEWVTGMSGAHNCAEKLVESVKAQQKETIELLKNLIDVGTGKIGHDYMGKCPDDLEGYTTRDRGCPACKILMRAKKVIKELKK